MARRLRFSACLAVAEAASAAWSVPAAFAPPVTASISAKADTVPYITRFNSLHKKSSRDFQFETRRSTKRPGDIRAALASSSDALKGRVDQLGLAASLGLSAWRTTTRC
jgi:hypothetical protein